MTFQRGTVSPNFAQFDPLKPDQVMISGLNIENLYLYLTNDHILIDYKLTDALTSTKPSTAAETFRPGEEGLWSVGGFWLVGGF